ncbi:MAG: histidine phosphatase family protein [Mangrovibacterium sp.]
MIEFCLIRHGETLENAQGICQGQTPGTLSDEGLAQARVLGEVFCNEDYDLLFSSDLKRTMETAEEIARYHPGKPLLAEPLLRERYLAAWQGKPFPKNWQEIDLPAGAETADDLIARAEAFIRLLKEKHEGQKVLAMSHGGLIRAFWTVLHGFDHDSYYHWDAPKNTSISRFELYPDGTVNVTARNLADHLERMDENMQPRNPADWQL